MKGVSYFFFQGYYFVAAASELLDGYLIPNRIVKAPVKLKNSCSFAVVTETADADECCGIFERHGIVIEQKIDL